MVHLPDCITVMSVMTSLDVAYFLLYSSQGEDGFPGFKGDMGLKGDRVRAHLDDKNGLTIVSPDSFSVKRNVYGA